MAALTTLQRITETLSRPWALASIAEAQAQAGDRLAAARSLAAALTSVREVTDGSLRAFALSKIARVQTGVGEIAAALSVVEDLNEGS